MGILATIRFCVVVIGLTIVLYANASDFDMTEGKTIGIMGGLLAMTEYGPMIFRKKDTTDES